MFIPRHVFIEIVSYLTDTEQNISGIRRETMIIIIKLCIGAVRVAGSVSLDDVYLHVQLKSIITPFVAFLRNTKYDVAAGHTKARV